MMKTTAPRRKDPQWEALAAQLDVEWSYRLAKRMEKYKTNPVLGYRTAGSRAEYLTGQMLAEEMAALGLVVTQDEFTLDGWDFHHARLSYIDPQGNLHSAELGGYQTDFDTQGKREYTLINAGRGTARELDQLDLAGKLALVAINQRDDWWINYPAYQAHLRGAAGILAVQMSGYGEVNAKSLNTQDICGPRNAPAFSLSKRDAMELMDRMGLEFGECAQVFLDARSTVMPGAKSRNIVGTIPGREPDAMIILSAHYDSYFEGFQDDNTAVSMMLGIARAILQSGYRPQKTLVFCAMAAEEWGVIDSRYDWSTGAYNQIFRLHPEWVGRAVANLNFELPAHTHGKRHKVRSVYEYKKFLQEQIRELPASMARLCPKGVGVICPVQTWSDDFSMSIAGVPSMVNEFGTDSFMETHYHSQYDNDSAYDQRIYTFHHLFYSRLLLAFDRLALPPLDFSERLWALDESLWNQHLAPRTEGAFRRRLTQAAKRADRITQWIWELNEAAGPQSRPEELAPLRRELLELFRWCQDQFVRLNWNEEPIFPHENTQEIISCLHKAAWQLAAGDVRGALASLCQVDDNRYADNFDPEVVEYFAKMALDQPPERLMWGAGRLCPRLPLDGLIREIRRKKREKEKDFAPEIAWLQRLQKEQQRKLADQVREETALLVQLDKRLERLEEDFPD